MSDTYPLSKVDRILSGSKTTKRSNARELDTFLQGIEINQIGMLRSGLPILGRNPRYKLIDVTLTGSITDSNFFLDIDASSDFGAGTDDIDIKLPNGKIKEVISFAIGSEDFGYGKNHVDSVPYFDLEKFNAVKYIENNAPLGMEPIVGSFPSYSEKLTFNGIIEPFEIRRRALGLNTFLEDEGQPGAVVGFNDPVITDFSYDSRENDLRAEFYEDVGTKGFSGFGSPMDQASQLLEAEFLSNISKVMFPFKERDNADLLISDSEIESIQLSMDPTLDEGTLPVTHVDMTVGFDAESRDRVNSIVFRGMTRR
mgnify:CR=1 FL=1